MTQPTDPSGRPSSSDAAAAPNGFAHGAPSSHAPSVAGTSAMPDLPVLDEGRLFAAVRSNPDDFESWTMLLGLVERENKEPSICAAFDAFLALYPYCFGYWKKYADLAYLHGGDARCREVYERAVAAFPRSVDLWAHYTSYATGMAMQDVTGAEGEGVPEDSAAAIRDLFARGEEQLRHDWNAAPFWDVYAAWEGAQDNLRNVFALYERLVRLPFDQRNGRMIDRIVQLANATPVSTLLSEETYAAHAAAVRAANAEVKDADVDGLVRDRILASCIEASVRAESEAEKRAPFEHNITRSYFHVRPLGEDQLENWRAYLEFEEKEGSLERAVHLYERCLVACAPYDEFWVQYARFLTKHGRTEDARAVFARATDIHLRRKHSIHIARALFEEATGNIDLAETAFARLDELPVSAESIDRRANFERRRHGLQGALHVFDQALARIGDSQPRVSAYVACRRAGVLLRAGDVDGCRAALRNLAVVYPDNKHIFVRLLDVELHYGSDTDRRERVLAVFDLAARSRMSADARYGFAVRKTEFLDDEGSSVSEVLSCEAELQWIHGVGTRADGRPKRPYEDLGGSGSDGNFRLSKVARSLSLSLSGPLQPPGCGGGPSQAWYGQRQPNGPAWPTTPLAQDHAHY